ncbi:MAG: hypothetical protein K8W52_20415 [Deltaproteobacteria bacterium]|nr:hypothetical protein [Deltaproteobacteria bacterium]
MKVLVAYGSKRGGTAEIAARIAGVLRERGLEVDCARAASIGAVSAYDAVILGGALYASRWVREARRFVARHAAALRARVVWMFSSGPLDDSARGGELTATGQVRGLMARIGARGHVTFGGRLAPDAKGFPASAMAKTRAGDWRDWAQVRAWAGTVADALAIAPPPRAQAPAASAPMGWLLVALCLLVGITAVGGGAVLVARPDGSAMQMPLSVLAHAPFASFLVPGLLLLLVVGGGNLVAGALVARRSPRATAAAFEGGAALFGWIVTEMVMLRATHWLQLTYFGIACAIMVIALRRHAIARA